MAMTTEQLADVEAAYRAASARAEELRERRNAAVREAVGDGMSQAQIARAMSLTRSRVGQIAEAKGLAQQSKPVSRADAFRRATQRR